MAILFITVIVFAGAIGYFLPRGLLAAGAFVSAYKHSHHSTVTALVVAALPADHTCARSDRSLTMLALDPSHRSREGDGFDSLGVVRNADKTDTQSPASTHSTSARASLHRDSGDAMRTGRLIAAAFGVVGGTGAYAAGASWWAACIAFFAVALAASVAVDLIRAQSDKPFPNDLVFRSLHTDQRQDHATALRPVRQRRAPIGQPRSSKRRQGERVRSAAR